MKDVAGIFCVGNGADRLMRGLMPGRGALVPESFGCKSRSVSSTHEKSSQVNAGSSVSGSSKESPCEPDLCLYADLFAKFSLR